MHLLYFFSLHKKLQCLNEKYPEQYSTTYNYLLSSKLYKKIHNFFIKNRGFCPLLTLLVSPCSQGLCPLRALIKNSHLFPANIKDILIRFVFI